MEMSFDEQGLTSIQVNGAPAESPSFGLTTGDLLNPAATFVSNSAILIAWTDGYCGESGLLEYCFPDPENPPPPASLAQLNLMQAQQEMVLSTVVFKVDPPFVDPRWILGEKFRIADPPGEVPDPADRRVDGMAAIAADLSVMSDDPPGGEAIVAWVRYEGDFLVLDGTKTIYVPLPDGQTQICPRQGGGFKTCRFETQTVDNIRPQMELTSIYARRVSLSGPIQGEDKVNLSPPGINIEPAVALSPSGDIGYCVWVHDPSPMTGHVDLTGSNLGCQLLYSVYSRQTNSWSAPVSVLPVIADYDDKFPGVLEPHIALKDNLNGRAGRHLGRHRPPRLPLPRKPRRDLLREGRRQRRQRARRDHGRRPPPELQVQRRSSAPAALRRLRARPHARWPRVRAAARVPVSGRAAPPSAHGSSRYRAPFRFPCGPRGRGSAPRGSRGS